MKWEFLINPNSYESESSSHAMPKRKATKKQLRNLAKGRAIRKSNLLKKRRQKRRAKPKRKMAKRRRTDGSLTGGTGDVNPQYFNMTLTQLNPNALTEAAFNTPVVRLPGPSGRVTIMELLKVYWMAVGWSPGLAAILTQSQYMSLSSVPMGIIAIANLSEPNVIAQLNIQQTIAWTAAGSLADSQDHLVSVDLTDGAGHGILFAGDRIYMQISTANMVGNKAFHVKILYRFKTVSLTEYVGIVQSQQ